MNELALFAGAGGGILGGQLLGWRCVCAVEKEPYCREVLLRRQLDGVLPVFPIWDDIHTFDGRAWRGKVDVVSAGFPCQPFSVAGRRKGKDDDRNLWPETIRVVREVGAPRVFLENVPGLLAHDYFGQIIGDLAEAGYDAEWGVVSAAEIGANHRRERLWMVADSRRVGTDRVQPVAKRWSSSTSNAGADGEERIMADSQGMRRQQGKSVPGQGTMVDADGSGEAMADTSEEGRSDVQGREEEQERHGEPSVGPSGWWATEPDVGRVANGVAHRVDRLRALGNGQVPAVAREAYKRLTLRRQDRESGAE